VANERRRIAATVVAVLLLATLMVGWLRVVELRDETAQLDATAEALAAGIGRELDRIAELGSAASASLARIDELDSDGYEALFEQLRVTERYPSVLGASWVVGVTREDLEEVVAQRQRADGRFRLRSDAGGDELRLIFHVYPRSRNALALGVDVTGLPDPFEASERSRATGTPALSRVTQLVQLPPGEAGAVLYVPQPAEDGSVDRWLGLTFAGEVLLDQLRPLPTDVSLRVVDPASEVFTELGRLGSAAVGSAGGQAPVERFGQRWLVEVRPGPGFATPWPRRASTLAALGGLVAALLLAGLVQTLSSRERRAQVIAARRTQELAAVNADLAQLNVALRDANAGKDAFLASVSHELRTPLTVIAGFTDALRRMRDDPDLDLFLDPIQRNVRRLDGLVSDLLTLASLDAGAVEVFPEDLDLAALARLAPAELAGLPEGQVTVEGAHAPIRVLADQRHVERILTNLLTNAARHGAPPIELGLEPDGEEVVLWVRDHGTGVDPAVEAQLFQRFVRGPRTVQVAGTGLGLAIIRELAELNCGSASYRPAAPGARFEVRLPAAPQAEAAEPATVPVVAPAEASGTVRPVAAEAADDR
jgi:signal transduction histidine kinase